MHCRSPAIVAALWSCLAVLAVPMSAAASYIELIDGDLSGNYLSPTSVALLPNGSTTISGTIAGAGAAVSTDLDYFTVTVPAGQVLSSVFVRSGTTSGGAIGSFIGIFPGATGTDPAITTSSDLLGYYLYRQADINTDILDDIGTFNFNGTNPSQGFVPPLLANDYTFWIQEGANGTFSYNFDLVLTQAIPEPATATLLLTALGVLAVRRRATGPRVTSRKLR
jgi:hypothetical protein